MATSWLDSYGINPKRKYDSEDSPRPGQTMLSALFGVNSPSSPPPKIQLSPGYTPDYKKLILEDPSYLNWKNNAQTDMQQAAAQRRAVLRAIAIQYGGFPSGVQDAYGDLDQSTLDLAKQNQYSDLARLGRNYDTSVDRWKRDLAARGMLQSGELQYGLDKADLARATSEYDLGREFSNTFAQAIQNYVGAEAAKRQEEWQALQAAQSNVLTNPLNQPTSGVDANLDPDWQMKWGQPVYVGPDGSLYVPDGGGHLIPFTPSVGGERGKLPGYTPPPAGRAVVTDWADSYGLPLRGLTYAS